MPSHLKVLASPHRRVYGTWDRRKASTYSEGYWEPLQAHSVLSWVPLWIGDDHKLKGPVPMLLYSLMQRIHRPQSYGMVTGYTLSEFGDSCPVWNRASSAIDISKDEETEQLQMSRALNAGFDLCEPDKAYRLQSAPARKCPFEGASSDVSPL